MALSYVWGNESQTGHIQIDSFQAVITKTLAAALQNIRSQTQVIRIWADAICIDQSNFDERAIQVSLMGHIYSMAQHTIIYLGCLDADVETVLRHLPSNTSGDVENTLGKLEPTEIAERNLLQRPWFNRAWVFQELVLSRDPWIQCGAIRARWTDLCSCILMMESDVSSEDEAPKQPLLTYVPFQHLSAIQNLQDMNSAREEPEKFLFELLPTRRGIGVTDPRDMIFALLGITTGLSDLKKFIDVTYEQSCESLYEATARYIVDTCGIKKLIPMISTQFLGWNTSGEPKWKKLTKLVSWAPDWTVPGLPAISDPPNWTYPRSTVIEKLDAPELENSLKLAMKGRFLALVKGFEIDRISSYSCPFPNRGHIATVLAQFDTEFASLTAYPNRPITKYYIPGFSLTLDRKLTNLICTTWELLIETNLNDPKINSKPFIGIPGKEERYIHSQFKDSMLKWLKDKRVERTWERPHGIQGMMLRYLHPQSGPQERSLQGRCLAITTNGRLAVVPAQVRQGDVIAHLADPHYLVRSVSLPRSIQQSVEIQAKDKSGKAFGALQSYSVWPCELIGESYCEPLGMYEREETSRKWSHYYFRRVFAVC